VRKRAHSQRDTRLHIVDESSAVLPPLLVALAGQKRRNLLLPVDVDVAPERSLRDGSHAFGDEATGVKGFAMLPRIPARDEGEDERKEFDGEAVEHG
jgi:hypothetical protein